MIMNGPSREELNAKVAASAAETAVQIAKLDGKMDRMMAEMHKSMAEMHKSMTDMHKAISDNLKWAIGLVCMVIALSMSMLNFMMRSYVDDAVRKAVDERLPTAGQGAGRAPQAAARAPPAAGKSGY
jgi:predicted transcriptional regulator YheO